MAGCGSGSDSPSSDELRNSVELTITGSVGDGPVTDAAITVLDKDDQEVTSTVSTEGASYTVTVPEDTLFPLTLVSTGGTDLVTGRPPELTMRAVVFDTGASTVNVSPLTTLVRETAVCGGGEVTAESLADITRTVLTESGMGFPPTSDPSSAPVTEDNIASVVLANEALGEAVRRTRAALLGTDAEGSHDDVLTAIACDLADGVIDGAGTGASTRVAMTFHAASAAVLLETIAHRLDVDGTDAMGPMDESIRAVLPATNGISTADLPATDALIAQARDALAILQGLSDDDAITEYLVMLDETATAVVDTFVANSLDAEDDERFKGLATLVALADATALDAAAEKARGKNDAPLPLLAFASNADVVPPGESARLTWASSGADRCLAQGGWSGVQDLEGSFVTPPLAAPEAYRLSCAGLGGTVTQAVQVSVEGVSAAPPVVDLSADPATIEAGSSVLLSWTSTGATSCTGSGGWDGALPLSGSAETGALRADRTFTLTCTGAGGESSASVSIDVTAPSPSAPTVSLDASPDTVIAGAGSTLSWSATNAESCSASGAWSGGRATSGSAPTGPLESNATFTLICTGPGGSASDSATVSVTPAPPAPGAPSVDLAASDDTVAAGESVTLTWSSANATACSASGDWSGERPTSGNAGSGALTSSATFTLTCSGAGGSASDSVSVSVNTASPDVELSANPPGVAPGQSTTLSWSSSHASSCSASGGWSGSKATAGSESTGPIDEDTTFSLTCTGPGGNAVAMITVSVRTATLTWEAPTQNVDGSELTDLAGYRVYYGTRSRDYGDPVAIDNPGTTKHVLSLGPGTWYFSVSAVDGDGNESDLSNEVSKTIN